MWELEKYTVIIKKGDMLEQSRQLNIFINSLDPDITALCGGRGGKSICPFGLYYRLNVLRKGGKLYVPAY